MIVILAQTQSLFLSVEPLDIDGSFSACNDLSFQTIDSLLSISEGSELNQGTSHEFLIFFHELDVKNDSISFKEFPDLILIPCSGQITDINN